MIIQSWDTAIKTGKTNDYSVCLTLAFQENQRVHQLLDCWRAQVEYPQLKRQLLRLACDYEPDVILIEDKASGQSLLQDLRRETQLPLVAIMPKGDKLCRVARVSPLLEAGKVALPKNASWLAAFESEIGQFPCGVHDDQVDALTQYLNWMREREMLQLRIRSI